MLTTSERPLTASERHNLTTRVERARTESRTVLLKTGAVSADTFTTFVRRAVAESWVEGCSLWRSDEGKTCRGERPRRVRTPSSPPRIDNPDSPSDPINGQFGR